MDYDDVFKRHGTEFECCIKFAIEEGIRIGKLEIMDSDKAVLVEHSAKIRTNKLKQILEKSLKNIPGFERLCPFCPGELDCTSDHK